MTRPSTFAACLESIQALASHGGFARNHLRTALDRIDDGDIKSARRAIVETLEYIGDTK